MPFHLPIQAIFVPTAQVDPVLFAVSVFGGFRTQFPSARLLS